MISNAIRAIIFDLGGVILRTDDRQSRNELAKKLGVTPEALEDIVFNNPVARRAEEGQVPVEEAWIETARLLHFPKDEIPAVRKAFFQGDQVDFGLIEFIQQLRGRFTTLLLSNTWVVDLPRFLRDDLQIPDTFDYILSSADLQMAKPSPRIFQRALDMAQCRPEEAIFVDDAERNILAAAALGIRTVRFRSTEQAEAEVLALIEASSSSTAQGAA